MLPPAGMQHFGSGLQHYCFCVSRCPSPSRFLVVDIRVLCPFFHEIETLPDSLRLSQLISVLLCADENSSALTSIWQNGAVLGSLGPLSLQHSYLCSGGYLKGYCHSGFPTGISKSPILVSYKPLWGAILTPLVGGGMKVGHGDPHQCLNCLAFISITLRNSHRPRNLY